MSGRRSRRADGSPGGPEGGSACSIGLAEKRRRRRLKMWDFLRPAFVPIRHRSRKPGRERYPLRCIHLSADRGAQKLLDSVMRKTSIILIFRRELGRRFLEVRHEPVKTSALV